MEMKIIVLTTALSAEDAEGILAAMWDRVKGTWDEVARRVDLTFQAARSDSRRTFDKAL